MGRQHRVRQDVTPQNRPRRPDDLHHPDRPDRPVHRDAVIRNGDPSKVPWDVLRKNLAGHLVIRVEGWVPPTSLDAYRAVAVLVGRSRSWADATVAVWVGRSN